MLVGQPAPGAVFQQPLRALDFISHLRHRKNVIGRLCSKHCTRNIRSDDCIVEAFYCLQYTNVYYTRLQIAASAKAIAGDGQMREGKQTVFNIP